MASVAARRYRELIVWQLATEFRREVLRLIRQSPLAERDFKFRDQLFSSARGISKHIAEGFLRFSPHELKRFLGFAISSLGEAEDWLHDGIESGYYTHAECQPAFRFAKRLMKGMVKLKQAQDRYIGGKGTTPSPSDEPPQGR